MGGQFTWFTGVVEDRFDPEEMNRVRVRCFGYHSENLSDISIEDLPWATVMMPTTASGTSGIGDTPHGLMEGSWVVGFFRDGPSAQDPIIMGTIASKNSPRSKTLGFGANHFPREEYMNESDINYAGRESRYKVSDAYQDRELGLTDQTVATASPAKITSVSPDKADSYYEDKPWGIMPPLGDDRTDGEHAPDYPYNKVNQSEGGHITEVDDTPGFERTHRMHSSGTYEEIYTNGTRSVKIVGEDYEVVFSNKNIHIKGNCNMTVDGDLRQLIYGNYHLEVEKDMTMNIKGSLQQKIGGNHESEIVRGRSVNVGTDDSLTVMNNSTTSIINDKLLTVGNDFTTSVTNNMATTVINNATLTNAGTFSHTSLKDYTLSVNANQTIGVVGTLGETVDGAVTETYGNTQTTDISGAQTITAASMDINGGSAIDMDAGRIDLN